MKKDEALLIKKSVKILFNTFIQIPYYTIKIESITGISEPEKYEKKMGDDDKKTYIYWVFKLYWDGNSSLMHFKDRESSILIRKFILERLEKYYIDKQKDNEINID